MKVSVTFEVGDEARIGIALRETGELRPATRIECASWLGGMGDMALRGEEQRVHAIKVQLLDMDTPLEPVSDAELTG
jgi:hypothetical protein